MALGDCKTGYRKKNGKLYVVVCVVHSLEMNQQKHVNRMLKIVQDELKKETKMYEEIQVAFVGETPDLFVKDFSVYTKETPYFYKELCQGGKSQMSYVLLMGLSLLQEIADQEIEAEKRLYLLTEERFSREQTAKVVYEQDGNVMLHPRFGELEFVPKLYKTKEAGGDLLETYFQKRGSVHLVED